MKLRYALAAAGLAALLAGSLAFAATTGGLFSTLPTVPVTQGLSGNELVPADTELSQGVNPQSEIVSTTQLRATQYSQQVPLTGFTISAPAGLGMLQLNPAGTLATGTINFPATPIVDGQQFCIFDTQTQTAVTLAPTGTGVTIAGTAVTALTANTRYCWTFAGTTANATTALSWFRTQ